MIKIVKIPKFAFNLVETYENVLMRVVNSSVDRMHYAYQNPIDPPVSVLKNISAIQMILKMDVPK